MAHRVKPRKTEPIQGRIVAALRDGVSDYHRLMRATFPEADYPQAFRYQSHGGPPGCAMAFRRALNALEADGVIERRRHDGVESFFMVRRVPRR